MAALARPPSAAGGTDRRHAGTAVRGALDYGTGGRVFTFDRGSKSIGNDNQVQLTSPAAWSQRKVLPLPPAEACAPAGNSVVQMWRTIPLRPKANVGPFVRGEFTVTAGVANAVKQATQLITVWDQYFWSEPFAKLDCAVLDTSVVRTHLANLYACLTGQPWSQFTPGWLHDYWAGMAGKTSQTLIPDPFWARVQNPQTPNGVAMTCTAPGTFKNTENQFEPTSIASPLPHLPLRAPLEQATCTLPGCAGDPGAPGRLDEVSFLLERCRQDPGTILSSEWLWRQPNASS